MQSYEAPTMHERGAYEPPQPHAQPPQPHAQLPQHHRSQIAFDGYEPQPQAPPQPVAQPRSDYAPQRQPLQPAQQQQGGGFGRAAESSQMRGCEGYRPNLAAFADGGLQSSSTELGGPQQVGRSSTRLHAPPGGSSQIVFG